MIEELEHQYISHDIGNGGPTKEEIIEKVNEIIRYLNEKENNDGNEPLIKVTSKDE